MFPQFPSLAWELGKQGNGLTHRVNSRASGVGIGRTIIVFLPCLMTLGDRRARPGPVAPFTASRLPYSRSMDGSSRVLKISQ